MVGLNIRSSPRYRPAKEDLKQSLFEKLEKLDKVDSAKKQGSLLDSIDEMRSYLNIKKSKREANVQVTKIQLLENLEAEKEQLDSEPVMEEIVILQPSEEDEIDLPVQLPEPIESSLEEKVPLTQISAM